MQVDSARNTTKIPSNCQSRLSSFSFLSIAASVVSIFFMNVLSIIFQYHGLNNVVANTPQNEDAVPWEDEMTFTTSENFPPLDASEKRSIELISVQHSETAEFSDSFLLGDVKERDISGGGSIVE